MQKVTALISFFWSAFGVVVGATNVPITFHDIVVVEPSGDAVIRLKGYDLDGDKVCLFMIIYLFTINPFFPLFFYFSFYKIFCFNFLI